MAALRLETIRHPLIEPVNLEVAAGELVFLSGPSGSGKSLLLRAVADLDPHEGEVWIGDEARSSMAPPLWRQRVGLLPAESFWWSDRVGEHFPKASMDADVRVSESRPKSTGLRTKSMAGFAVLPRSGSAQPTPSSPAEHRSEPVLTDWLCRLGFEPDVLDWSVGRLSTGERQRLAFIRLLAQRPEVLLLDEATANLDPVNRDGVERLIDDYRTEAKAAVLWVSHDPEQRARLSTRAYVIRDGALEVES